MWGASLSTHQQFLNPNPYKTDQDFNFKNPTRFEWSKKQSSVSLRCCLKKSVESKNHYELLGVSVDANAQDIKNAYRKLQKKYHPDIVGEKGHESTLMLNKAYKVLVREDLRKEYDESIGRIRFGIERNTFGSIWREPLRPQALFVDENACVGCRKCVHHAGNTFTMDEARGTARVKTQYGDDDTMIEVLFFELNSDLPFVSNAKWTDSVHGQTIFISVKVKREKVKVERGISFISICPCLAKPDSGHSDLPFVLCDNM